MHRYWLILLGLVTALNGVASFRPQWQTATNYHRRSSSLSMFNVRVINKKKNTDFTVSVPSGKIILDTAETQGVSIPYSCRAGSCSSCIGKLTKGQVDQSGQIFLNDKQIDAGYVLTCVATPLSDIEVEVDIEDQFYNENPEMVQ